MFQIIYKYLNYDFLFANNEYVSFSHADFVESKKIKSFCRESVRFEIKAGMRQI
jgi:hypothetical protein